MKYFLLLVVTLVLGATTMCQQAPQKVFTEVGLDQKLGSWVPLDLSFRNEQGDAVTLRSLMNGKPVVLALVYYECPMICTEVLNGMVKSFKHLPLEMGKDYVVITVSINPREQPPLASTKKQRYLQEYGNLEVSGAWHFLTGEDSSIKPLADAIGYRYVYDEATKQYAHPAGLVVVTPQGQVARYLYGVEFPPKDLKFALVEASHNTVGSAVDQVLLLCYHYDPMTGKYGLVIMNLIRIGALLTILFIVGTIVLFALRDRRKRRKVLTPA